MVRSTSIRMWRSEAASSVRVSCSNRSLSRASEALEISSRRKMSLSEYSEWTMRSRSCLTSAWNSWRSADPVDSAGAGAWLMARGQVSKQGAGRAKWVRSKKFPAREFTTASPRSWGAHGSDRDRQLIQELRADKRSVERQLQDRAWRGHRPAGPERSRQDHAHEDLDRLPGAGHRRCPGAWQRRRVRSDRRAAPDRLSAGERAAVRRDAGPGVPGDDGGDARCAGGAQARSHGGGDPGNRPDRSGGAADRDAVQGVPAARRDRAGDHPRAGHPDPGGDEEKTLRQTTSESVAAREGRRESG